MTGSWKRSQRGVSGIPFRLREAWPCNGRSSDPDGVLGGSAEVVAGFVATGFSIALPGGHDRPNRAPEACRVM